LLRKKVARNGRGGRRLILRFVTSREPWGSAVQQTLPPAQEKRHGPSRGVCSIRTLSTCAD
jgi:hypothetical protein